MYIKSAFAQNFMPFREMKVNFNEYSGITLIEGRSDSASRDSNGSGKSSILDVITWTLYGKLLRKQKSAESVVNRFHPHDRTVCIVALDVDGREIVVERSRYKNVPSLRISGIDAGKATTKGQQELLEGILGMDYRLFTSTVMFGGASSSFCSMTDAERKKLLEEMLEFDYFLAAQQVAAGNVSELESKIENENNRIRSLLDTAIELESSAKEHDQKALSYEEENNRILRSRIADNFDAAVELHECIDEILLMRKELVEKLRVYKEDMLVWQDAHDKAETAFNEAEEALDAINIKVAEENAVLREKQREMARVTPDKHPDLCPTCGQRWPQKDSSGMDNILKDKRKNMEAQQGVIAALSRDHAKVSAVRERADAALRKVQEDEPESPDQLAKDILDAVNDLERLEQSNKHMRALCSESYRKSDNPHIEAAASLRKKAVDSREKAEAVRESIKDIEQNLEIQRYWSKAFGKSGIPSLLLDSAVPLLNKISGEISEELTDGELDIFFDPTTAKGSSSIFDVQVEFKDGGDSYDMSSRGEHSRVDLAVLLTIREMLAQRGRRACTQVFVDEVFDGLDAHGIQSVMTLLRKRYKKMDFFVVSHDPELKSYADNVITVAKKKSVSTIL